MNSVLKRLITSSFAAWLAVEAKKQFDNNVTASDFKMDLSLTTLREPFILGVVSAKYVSSTSIRHKSSKSITHCFHTHVL